MTAKIVLFGATGYTGKKTAKALCELDLRPLLVARNEKKLSLLSEELGGLPYKVADVENPRAIRNTLESGDVLLTTVGPFLRWGDVALECARDAGAHYIDSTGEPAFVRRVFEQYDAPARKAGRTWLSAFGYDYVPGNVAAAAAIESAGPKAVKVEVGYFIAGGRAFRRSQGTDASLMGSLLEPGLFWRGGKLVEDGGGTRLAHFLIDGKRLPGISVPASEHLALPRSYQQLEEVGVYLGWFGKQSYVMHRMSQASTAFMRLPGARGVMSRLLPKPGSSGKGPSDAELEDAPSHITATAYDRGGVPLATATLTGTDGYTYTARMLAWGARALAEEMAQTPGALGPIEAFGLDTMIEANRACGLELHTKRGARR